MLVYQRVYNCIYCVYTAACFVEPAMNSIPGCPNEHGQETLKQLLLRSRICNGGLGSADYVRNRILEELTMVTYWENQLSINTDQAPCLIGR